MAIHPHHHLLLFRSRRIGDGRFHGRLTGDKLPPFGLVLNMIKTGVVNPDFGDKDDDDWLGSVDFFVSPPTTSPTRP